MKTMNKGFTLFEILVGVAIMSLVFIFVYSSVNFSATIGANMEEQAVVGNILDLSAEYVHSLGESSFDSITSSLDIEAGVPGVSEYLQDQFRNHTLSVSVQNYGSPSLKQVTITFQWKPRGKRIIDKIVSFQPYQVFS